MKRILLTALLMFAASCAVVQPPSGGPEDREPPHVVSVVPAPDSAGVERDSDVRISFSENVDGETFKERVRLYPEVGFDEIKVKGNILRISFSESLPETTLTLLLSSGYADLHGVRTKESFTFHFSTEPRIQDGTINGKVLFKNEIDPKGVVKLHEIIPDSALSYKTERESRIAFAGEDGGFSFNALPTDGTPFILWAFSDKNDDGLYAEEREFHTLYPDTFRLMPSRRMATEIFINIIDPNEPGRITGTIIDETGFGRPPMIRFDPVMPGETALVFSADSAGSFVVSKIPPGRYLVQAFVDLAMDSLCGTYVSPEDSALTLREPCLELPDTLVVEPGGETILEPVTLTGDTE